MCFKIMYVFLCMFCLRSDEAFPPNTVQIRLPTKLRYCAVKGKQLNVIVMARHYEKSIEF